MAYRNREREIFRGHDRSRRLLRGTVGYRWLGLGGTVPNELTNLTSGEWGGWRGGVDSEKKQKRTLGVKRGLAREATQQVGVHSTAIVFAKFPIKVGIHQRHDRSAVVHELQLFYRR
jgi:hypothetical protein